MDMEELGMAWRSQGADVDLTTGCRLGRSKGGPAGGIGLIEGWAVDGQAPAGGRAQPGGTPTVIDLGGREKRASGGGVGHRHTVEVKSPYFYRPASNQ
jgi:hypothetical protein